jgi:hypothetical protein
MKTSELLALDQTRVEREIAPKEAKVRVAGMPGSSPRRKRKPRRTANR